MADSLKSYQQLTQEALNNHSFPKEPANLYDPIRYFLSLGGKRMRPVMTLMGYDLFGNNVKDALEAAVGIELFHNFTLIHDDIMDKAPLRRGQATVHHKWNENIGILSGDVLFVEAYKCLSSAAARYDNRILIIFNKTAEEVCIGQQMDMDFESRDDVSIEEYLEMIRLKTAVLAGCSFEIGAIIGGASESEARELYEFGSNLGIAFQLQDDLLDVYADDALFGKQVGGDIIANKKTYLLLKAKMLANPEQQSRLSNLSTEADLDKKVAGVKEIYSELNIEELTRNQMNDFYRDAMNHLDQISSEKKEGIVQLAQFLMNREH